MMTPFYSGLLCSSARRSADIELEKNTKKNPHGTASHRDGAYRIHTRFTNVLAHAHDHKPAVSVYRRRIGESGIRDGDGKNFTEAFLLMHYVCTKQTVGVRQRYRM